MGDIIVNLFRYTIITGIAFGLFLLIRNKWFRDDDDGIYTNGDQYVLLLMSYALIIFRVIDFEGVDIYFRVHKQFLQPDFIWTPFRNFVLQQEAYEFLNYVRQGGYGYSAITLSEYLIIYLRLFVISLPVAFLLNLISKRKWLGFVLTIIILASGYIVSEQCLIGDGLLAGGFAYLLVILGYKLLLKTHIVKIKWLTYISISGLIAVVLFFGVDIDFYSHCGRVELIKTIPLEKKMDTYNGLIHVRFDKVSFYKRADETRQLNFYGNIVIEDKLLKQSPFKDIENFDKESIGLQHEYSFNGKKQQQSSGQDRFFYNEKDLFLKYSGLMFVDYNPFKYDAEGNRTSNLMRENANEEAFFEYFGVSNLSFYLMEDDIHLSGFEILEEGFKTDQYLYYEVLYKLNKINGFKVDWYVKAQSYDKDSKDVDKVSISAEPEIVEETDDYIVIKEKYYYYRLNREDVDRVEFKVDSGYLKLDELEMDLESLFKIDEEMFE